MFSMKTRRMHVAWLWAGVKVAAALARLRHCDATVEARMYESILPDLFFRENQPHKGCLTNGAHEPGMVDEDDEFNTLLLPKGQIGQAVERSRVQTAERAAGIEHVVLSLTQTKAPRISFRSRTVAGGKRQAPLRVS